MDELKHYGVLGMRWGRRKGTSNISRVANDRKKEKAEKKEEKQVDKITTKRNTSLYINSLNTASVKLNSGEIDKFNAKWESKFKDSPNWAESKHYGAYIKAYADLQATEMDKALRANPESKFTTKSGKEYTARFLKESGNIVWGSNDQWSEYDKQK